MVNFLLTLPTEFVAATVNVCLPETVGLPETTPLADSFSPEGRVLPSASAQVKVAG